MLESRYVVYNPCLSTSPIATIHSVFHVAFCQFTFGRFQWLLATLHRFPVPPLHYANVHASLECQQRRIIHRLGTSHPRFYHRYGFVWLWLQGSSKLLITLDSCE